MPGTAESDTVVLAIHYQNENCHPDGKVGIGIGEDRAWSEQRLAAAKRLFAAARGAAVPIVHTRLALPVDRGMVIANTPVFRRFVEIGAWLEGSWGAEFLDGLGPEDGEAVVTHTRNNVFHNSILDEVLFPLRPRRLVICGVSTAYAVEHAVRHAADLGYDVTVAADACSTATLRQHEATLETLKLLAAIATVDEIVAEFRRLG
jgi:nicotinamidase-related amidase